MKYLKSLYLSYKIKKLKHYINVIIPLNLYFDGWSGEECIEAIKYYSLELNKLLTNK